MRTEFGDYAQEYGGVDYTDAVVLDVGADYGTTADFFLERGARRVIMLERRDIWIPKLEEKAANDERLSYEGRLSSENADWLVTGADIVKADCEGCERMLLALHDDVVRTPRAWIMEVHARWIHEAFRLRFGELGYTVTVPKAWPNNPPTRHRAIIQAVRP